MLEILIKEWQVIVWCMGIEDEGFVSKTSLACYYTRCVDHETERCGFWESQVYANQHTPSIKSLIKDIF